MVKTKSSLNIFLIGYSEPRIYMLLMLCDLYNDMVWSRYQIVEYLSSVVELAITGFTVTVRRKDHDHLSQLQNRHPHLLRRVVHEPPAGRLLQNGQPLRAAGLHHSAHTRTGGWLYLLD